MVDLGFLLISFFVFTTSIAHPTAMTLKIPDDKNIKDSLEAPKSKTQNLVLSRNDIVYAYDGDEVNNIQNLGSRVGTLRSVILQKKNEIKNQFGSDSDMVVLIKPTPGATYANVINALDEMQICVIKTYILMDADNTELKNINTH